jgi:serine/threonine protein kinase
MTYTGIKGKQYQIIDPPLGKGGEGSVYRISGMPSYVIKVFKDNKRTESRHRKLLAMIDSPLSPSAMQQVTWPVDVVYENGKFIGYIMPAIQNIEDLNVMYSDKYKCTLSENITIAKNLCAAVNSVHNAGQVCGDLNPKNIGVDPKNARVTLVDTDSYHITDRNTNREYRCEVGLPEYLAKEIQDKLYNNKDKDLTTISLPTFTKYTDLFALAVHIFALLMNGCHPFACAVDNNVNIGPMYNSQPSVTAPQPIENIVNGFFPFYHKKSGITTPKYAPSFDILPANIKKLFIRAFVDGNKNPKERPTSEEWYNALSDMQQNLKICSQDDKHMYSSHLKKCPWCELEKNMRAAIPISQQTSNSYKGTTTNSKTTSSATTSKKVKSPVTFATILFWIFSLLSSTVATAALGYFLSPVIYELIADDVNSTVTLVATIACAIAGFISSIIYNAIWSARAKYGKFKWYDYILNILTSVAIVIGIVIAIALIIAVGMIILAIAMIVLTLFLIGALLGGG